MFEPEGNTDRIQPSPADVLTFCSIEEACFLVGEHIITEILYICQIRSV